MFTWIFVLLMSYLLELTTGHPFDDDRSIQRNYEEEIGMVCSYNRTETKSMYLNIREEDQLGIKLFRFGRKRKVIFYITGYGCNINPDDGGKTLEKFEKTAKDMITDDSTMVCIFDFVHKNNLGSFSAIFDYRSMAMNRVPFTAAIIKNIAVEMYEKKVFSSFDHFQMIGFSLGAHIAGVTARLIKAKLGIEVPRIFALDPAKTLISDPEVLLKKTDAKYIQVIYTSSLSEKDLDVHSKVFINNGSNQPGCENEILFDKMFCDHNFIITLYERIASGEIQLFAYRKTKVKSDVRDYVMVVGHLYHANEIGVFYANTDESIPRNRRK